MTFRIVPRDHADDDARTTAAALPALTADVVPSRTARDVHLVVRVQSGVGRIHPAHVALAVESALAVHDPAGFIVIDVRTIEESEATATAPVDVESGAAVRPLPAGKRRNAKKPPANTRKADAEAPPPRLVIRLPFEVGP